MAGFVTEKELATMRANRDAALKTSREPIRPVAVARGIPTLVFGEGTVYSFGRDNQNNAVYGNKPFMVLGR